MLPYINIFGRQIATYGFIIVLGIIIGTMIAVFYFSKFNKVKKMMYFIQFYIAL